MAAERKAVSSKLKLVISYNDENDNLCEKSVQMRKLVNGADSANVVPPSTPSARFMKTPSRASMKS